MLKSTLKLAFNLELNPALILNRVALTHSQQISHQDFRILRPDGLKEAKKFFLVCPPLTVPNRDLILHLAVHDITLQFVAMNIEQPQP